MVKTLDQTDCWMLVRLPDSERITADGIWLGEPEPDSLPESWASRAVPGIGAHGVDQAQFTQTIPGINRAMTCARTQAVIFWKCGLMLKRAAHG
jgi:hypothetical protein